MRTKSSEIIFEYDGLTNQTIQREPTEQELAQKKITEAEQNALKAKAQEKKNARESAISKLTKLGLTADEIEALKS
jgi:hypothetical protein